MRDIEQILKESNTIAVVGASTNPAKAAYSIPATLQSAGFDIIPINPKAEEILGQPVRRSLADIDVPVDVVQVFRPSQEAPDIARAAASIGAKVLWLQLGLRSEEAKKIAEEGGMDYVEDRCMGVERARYGVVKAS
jgi:predicted CoA-binding protein